MSAELVRFFRGELVPKHLNDEAAAELVKRISKTRTKMRGRPTVMARTG